MIPVSFSSAIKKEGAFILIEIVSKKLEDPTITADDFDVSLIDKLIRRLKHITGFVDHNHDLWSKDEPSGTNTSIEYLIYQIKQHRNNASHATSTLSESQFDDKLNQLQANFDRILIKLNIKFGQGLATDLQSLAGSLSQKVFFCHNTHILQPS